MGPTSFVFVSSEMADAFRSEWRSIDQRFPPLGEAPDGVALEEHWQTLWELRNSARAELRHAMRAAASQYGGPYPIAV